MKNTILLCILFIVNAVYAQNVKRIDNLKDTWDVPFTYCGEVKDGKPNGMGVAYYESAGMLRYDGGFVNGRFQGKGVLFFKTGEFLSGDWKNGKLDGKATNLTGNGTLCLGDFSNHMKNGRGVLYYSDNSLMVGELKDDKLNGRNVYINSTGTIISDCYYVNDKKSGPGYQYEVDAKKLYEGEWLDGEWVRATTDNFSSFLSNPNFYAEKTDAQVLAGVLNAGKLLKDSSFFYDLGKRKKYFGYYIDGKLKNGIITRDDSTFFMGGIDDRGATGYCYDYKVKHYYTEGNYTFDLLNGKVWDIDLTKQSLYYGDVVNGKYTGKAYFFNKDGTIYAGDYLNGKFTGKGYKMAYDGKSINGTWTDGLPVTVTSITNRKGEVIPGNPKTLDEGVNIVVKGFVDKWDDIISGDETDILDIISADEDADPYDSYVTLPGSINKNYIIAEDDESNVFSATYLETDNLAAAKAKYNELAAKLKTVLVSNGTLKTKIKFTGTVIPPDDSKSVTSSEFTLPTTDPLYSRLKAWVNFYKDGDSYVVALRIGEIL